MKPWVARLVTYAVVGSLAAGALTLIRPLPPRRAADVLGQTEEAAPLVELVDSVSAGETIGKVLERGGIGQASLYQVLSAATTLNPRQIKAGMRVIFTTPHPDSEPSEITIYREIDKVLRVTRTASGWTAREDTLPWTVDTSVVQGQISSSLYDALNAAAAEWPAGARVPLAWDVADIFEHRVDMSRDLQPGDAIAVLVERRQGPGGVVRHGRILAATLRNAGATIQAFRHEREGARPTYYDQDGKSLHSNFLRNPLEFRRISSVFGMRRHPILGVMRRHQGTDYAANSGTPVRSVGDGVVVFAGVKGGYGNVIDVRHPNGFVTRYGHLRGFARGVRSGRRVAMGETVGYVGATGLATAPHLHFEVLVGGVQRNPRTALSIKSGEPLPAAERSRFDAVRQRYLALLQGTSATLANLAN